MFHLLGQKIDTYLSSIYDKGVIEEMVTSSMNDASSIGYLAEKKNRSWLLPYSIYNKNSKTTMDLIHELQNNKSSRKKKLDNIFMTLAKIS